MNPIWKAPWYRRMFPGASYLDTNESIDVILFELEQPVIINWDYFNEKGKPDPQKFPYRYRCLSCYAASGDRGSFVTQCEQKQAMKDGPTQEQQDQMSEHVRQHSIMWEWAKGLK